MTALLRAFGPTGHGARPQRREAPAGARLGRLAVRCAILALSAHTPAVAQSRIAVLEEPDGSAVAVSIALNAGTSWELDFEAGLTHLAARAIAEEVRPALDALGGRIAVECRSAATVFTLLLPPENWAQGVDRFLRALFGASVSEGAVERGRERLLRSFDARAGAFPHELNLAVTRALFGDEHRWARPVCGRADALARHDAEEVRRLMRSRFQPTRAAAAVAGPVTTAEARTVLLHALGEDVLPVLVPAPASGTGRGAIHVIRPTVTTWIGLAFPFPRDADPEALRLLAFRIREAFRPSFQRPDVFDAGATVEQHGDGGWLQVVLVTAPERAEDYANDVIALVRRAASEPLPRAEFENLRRRYRGRRLLELETPEARARNAALQLYFEQRFRLPSESIAALTRRRLQRAAAALGRPAVAVLGPE